MRPLNPVIVVIHRDLPREPPLPRLKDPPLELPRLNDPLELDRPLNDRPDEPEVTLERDEKLGLEEILDRVEALGREGALTRDGALTRGAGLLDRVGALTRGAVARDGALIRGTLDDDTPVTVDRVDVDVVRGAMRVTCGAAVRVDDTRGAVVRVGVVTRGAVVRVGRLVTLGVEVTRGAVVRVGAATRGVVVLEGVDAAGVRVRVVVADELERVLVGATVRCVRVALDGVVRVRILAAVSDGTRVRPGVLLLNVFRGVDVEDERVRGVTVFAVLRVVRVGVEVKEDRVDRVAEAALADDALGAVDLTVRSCRFDRGMVPMDVLVREPDWLPTMGGLLRVTRSYCAREVVKASRLMDELRT
jgi:hypothetical protein